MYKFRITQRSGNWKTLQELTGLTGKYIGSPDNVKEGLTKSLEKRLHNYLQKSENYQINLELLSSCYYKDKDVNTFEVLLKGYRKYPNKGVKLTIEIYKENAFSW